MATAANTATMLLLIVGAILCKAAYNFFLHPLRLYPGPVLARTTRLYYAYHLWRGTYCATVLKLHKKYGSVLRIAPDELSFANVEAWQDIYNQTFAERTADLEKDMTFYMAAPNGAESIITAPHDVHYRFRRLLQVPLSDRALMQQEPIIQDYVGMLMSRLHENSSSQEHPHKSINMVHWLEYTYFDILGDLVFSKPFGCLERGESHWWMDTIQAGVKAAFRIKTIERFIPGFFHLFMKLTALISIALRQDLEGNFMFCAVKARERLATTGDRPDFITYITEANKDHQYMTMAEIESNSQVLINAGTEPVATATCGILFYLLSRSDALVKASEEIRSRFTKEEEITISSTQHLPYLQAVIKEGMRLYPPAPMAFPRKTPPGGCVICSKFVPGGYSVGIPQNALNRSSSFWIDPDSYHPERWLQDPAFEGDQKKGYQPFSIGPRNCIGKSLALAEIRLILSRLLWNFNMGLAEESKSWDVGQKTFPFWDKPPLNIKLVPVDR